MDDAEPRAVLVVRRGTGDERVVPIDEYLVVGRQCGGVDESHRLLLDDEAVSRRHLEISLDVASDCASVVDLSTNGTRLNGVRIERGTSVPLHPGDRLAVGPVDLEFRSAQFLGDSQFDLHATVRGLSAVPMAIVVGDVVEYSTISEYTESRTLFQALDRLFSELRTLVVRFRGTVNSFPGDALLAVWEVEHGREAPADAVGFALAASERVHAVAPELPVRDVVGAPLRMGWSVALGNVAVSSLTGAHVAVIGDAANVAFRVASIAGRTGRPDVLVTDTARAALGDRFLLDAPEFVQVKGRSGAVGVFGVRTPS